MSAQRTFGGLFRRRPGASAPSAADPAAGAPAADVARPVEGYLESGTLDLMLHGPAGRLSDILNRATSLTVSRADGAAGAPDLAEVLLLVPPHESGDPQRHLHRPGRALRVVTGSVRGDRGCPRASRRSADGLPPPGPAQMGRADQRHHPVAGCAERGRAGGAREPRARGPLPRPHARRGAVGELSPASTNRRLLQRSGPPPPGS